MVKEGQIIMVEDDEMCKTLSHLCVRINEDGIK